MVMVTVRGVSRKKMAKSLLRVSYKLMWGLLLWSVSLKHSPEQNKIFTKIHTLWGVIRGWWKVTEGVEELAGSIFMVTYRLEYTSALL